jgi:uncharacterized protein YcaQ
VEAKDTPLHRLSLEEARRIAVGAQLLDAQRPADVVEVAEQLTVINIDPVSAVAPSEHLILWSRIGLPYEPVQLQRAIEVDRMLFEFDGMVRPVSDLPLYLPEMRESPKYARTREWLEHNDEFRRDLLRLLEAEGPLLSAGIPDTSRVPWPSTGWTNNRNVNQMLELLARRGEIAIAGREGRQRRWDLAERVYPPDLPQLSLEEAARLRDERRLRALGIARPKGTPQPGEAVDVAKAGEPAVVEGVEGQWRVDPLALGRAFEPRTALVCPFDRLVFDRERLLDLFDFEYLLEMYKPKAKRRWGYFALPILHGDRFVGKLDATSNRKEGTFDVAAIHEDVPFTAEIMDAVRTEIDDLAEWLGLEVRGLN